MACPLPSLAFASLRLGTTPGATFTNRSCIQRKRECTFNIRQATQAIQHEMLMFPHWNACAYGTHIHINIESQLRSYHLSHILALSYAFLYIGTKLYACLWSIAATISWCCQKMCKRAYKSEKYRVTITLAPKRSTCFAVLSQMHS